MATHSSLVLLSLANSRRGGYDSDFRLTSCSSYHFTHTPLHGDTPQGTVTGHSPVTVSLSSPQGGLGHGRHRNAATFLLQRRRTPPPPFAPALENIDYRPVPWPAVVSGHVGL